MTDFDPTTNRIPFELLTPEERAILKAWPHGWQMRDLDGNWVDRPDSAWSSLHMVYRGKPESVVKELFGAVYLDGFGDGYESLQDVLHTNNCIGFICAEIVDGKLKDVRVVEVEEDET